MKINHAEVSALTGRRPSPRYFGKYPRRIRIIGSINPSRPASGALLIELNDGTKFCTHAGLWGEHMPRVGETV